MSKPKKFDVVISECRFVDVEELSIFFNRAFKKKPDIAAELAYLNIDSDEIIIYSKIPFEIAEMKLISGSDVIEKMKSTLKIKICVSKTLKEGFL